MTVLLTTITRREIDLITTDHELRRSDVVLKHSKVLVGLQQLVLLALQQLDQVS